jgi:hypothetical protein
LSASSLLSSAVAVHADSFAQQQENLIAIRAQKKTRGRLCTSAPKADIPIPRKIAAKLKSP